MEEVLLAEYQLERGHLDALRFYVGNKGEKAYPETDEGGQYRLHTRCSNTKVLRLRSRMAGGTNDCLQGGTRIILTGY